MLKRTADGPAVAVARNAPADGKRQRTAAPSPDGSPNDLFGLLHQAQAHHSAMFPVDAGLAASLSTPPSVGIGVHLFSLAGTGTRRRMDRTSGALLGTSSLCSACLPASSPTPRPRRPKTRRRPVGWRSHCILGSRLGPWGQVGSARQPWRRRWSNFYVAKILCFLVFEAPPSRSMPWGLRHPLWAHPVFSNLRQLASVSLGVNAHQAAVDGGGALLGDSHIAALLLSILPLAMPSPPRGSGLPQLCHPGRRNELAPMACGRTRIRRGAHRCRDASPSPFAFLRG